MQLWAIQDRKSERFYNVEQGYWGLFCIGCLDQNKKLLEDIVDNNPKNYILVEYRLERI